MYGRCGRNRQRSAGRCTRPWPNGQMPASARNSVDLPEPERPVTTTDGPAPAPGRRPPAASRRPAARGDIAHLHRPSGASATSPVPKAARAATMARWNVVSRSTIARHGARSGYRVMNQDSASCTWPNAPAVWVSTPSGICAGEVARRRHHEREDDRDLLVAGGERVQHLGALHDRPPVADHAAKRWPRSPSPRPRRIQRDAFHVLAHPHQAKRKSASTRCWRKFSAASGRPTRWVSQVPTTA